MLLVCVAGIPAQAQKAQSGPAIPVVGGPDITVGSDGRQALTPPADGFTDVSAESSNPGVVTVDPPNSNAGGQGVDFKATGQGATGVTITWKNPKTKEVRKQYFVVAVGVKVERAEVVTTQVGQLVELVIYPDKEKLTTTNPSVAAPDPNHPSYVMAKTPGTAVIVHTDTFGKTTVKVVVVEAKAAPNPAPSSAFPHPGGGTGGQEGGNGNGY